MDETTMHKMSELAYMAAEMMTREEAEQRNLKEHIKDERLYEHVIKNLTAQYVLNTFVFADIYKQRMENPVATEKAANKAAKILAENIYAIVKEGESDNEPTTDGSFDAAE